MVSFESRTQGWFEAGGLRQYHATLPLNMLFYCSRPASRSFLHLGGGVHVSKSLRQDLRGEAEEQPPRQDTQLLQTQSRRWKGPLEGRALRGHALRR